MRRAGWLLSVAIGLAVNANPQDIADVASSPYELAKYVQMHHSFNWPPLWQALGIKDEGVFLPPCEEAFRGVPPCFSEVIAITEPPQVIVLLEHRESSFQVFLRYENSGPNRWRVSGSFAPNVKYFRPEHRILRLGAKPFLVITEQGISGSGVSSKDECWIDLTAADFNPVMVFTADGEYHAFPDGISRKTFAHVTSMATRPLERIELTMSVEFTAAEHSTGNIPLGRRSDRVVYVRNGTGSFKPVPNQSTATPDEVENFYEIHDTAASDQEFLKFHYKGLAAIAKGQDDRARAWLGAFVQRSPDIPETRELKSILAARR
jgi:hypothetical protein